MGVQLFSLSTRNGQRQLLNMAMLITTAMFRKTMLFLNPASRFFAEKLDTRTRLHPIAPGITQLAIYGSPVGFAPGYLWITQYVRYSALLCR